MTNTDITVDELPCPFAPSAAKSPELMQQISSDPCMYKKGKTNFFSSTLLDSVARDRELTKGRLIGEKEYIFFNADFLILHAWGGEFIEKSEYPQKVIRHGSLYTL